MVLHYVDQLSGDKRPNLDPKQSIKEWGNEECCVWVRGGAGLGVFGQAHGPKEWC